MPNITQEEWDKFVDIIQKTYFNKLPPKPKFLSVGISQPLGGPSQ